MDRWEVEKKIVKRALKDPAFKKELLAQPKLAIQKALASEGVNKDALEKLNIKVHEDKKGEWVIHIPCLSTEGQKLTDAELEKLFAASGCTWPCLGTK